MDRRYKEARGASTAGSRRGEAYARAVTAVSRRQGRISGTGSATPGRRSISEPGEIIRGRAIARQERNEIFDESGSGELGAGVQRINSSRFRKTEEGLV